MSGPVDAETKLRAGLDAWLTDLKATGVLRPDALASRAAEYLKIAGNRHVHDRVEPPSDAEWAETCDCLWAFIDWYLTESGASRPFRRELQSRCLQARGGNWATAKALRGIQPIDFSHLSVPAPDLPWFRGLIRSVEVATPADALRMLNGQCLLLADLASRDVGGLPSSHQARLETSPRAVLAWASNHDNLHGQAQGLVASAGMTQADFVAWVELLRDIGHLDALHPASVKAVFAPLAAMLCAAGGALNPEPNR